MNGLHSRASDSNDSIPASGTVLLRTPGAAPAHRTPGGLAVGDVVVGKYEILELLGAGGMGTVWRARSLTLDVDVAIKVLRRDQDDAIAVERLRREAQATARLGHPAIVRIFDCGETDAGEPFLVMELVEGVSLAAWLALRGRVPAAQAVQVLLPIAAGLAAAHAQGVVHRDVKPENILVAPGQDGGWVFKIVDFGIAKLVTRSGQVLTEEGMVLGSLPYMSPEQADGRDVDEQTDVWALSVVLYELITGQRPFEGNTLAAILVALHTKPPKPTTELFAGDPELWAIIARGLQRSRAARWHSMRALGEALARWATERGASTDATGASIEHRWLGRASDDFWPASRPAGERTSTPPSSPPALSFNPTARPLIAPVPEARELVPIGATMETPPPTFARSRTRTRLIHALIAIVALPVVPGLVGLGMRGWTTSTSAYARADALPTAAPTPSPEPRPATITTADNVPEASSAAAPAASAQPPTSQGKARGTHAALTAARKPSSPTMPLARAPNF